MEDGDADVAGGVYYISPQVFLAGTFVGRERERERWIIPLGWNIGVWNVILGGKCGYSGGNMR